jgi:cytochrome b561
MDHCPRRHPREKVGPSPAEREAVLDESQHLGLYVLAAAIPVLGVLAFCVPAFSLSILALLAVCPLMMVLMMKGLHAGALTTPGTRRTTSLIQGFVDRRQRAPETAVFRRRVPT